MNLAPNRQQRRALEAANRAFPAQLVEMPRETWPPRLPPGIERVWRSRDFLVQQYAERAGAIRLSICRTDFNPVAGRWVDGITWDELQRLKREAGYGNRWAVEIYPDDAQVVNVGNLRHLWLIPEPPAFAWRDR